MLAKRPRVLYNHNMAIAVFGDIHGNLEALEAILKDVKKRHIKQVYFLGDAITFGPNSSECLKLLQKEKVNCVIGNHEQRVIRYDKSVGDMTYAGIKHMEYIFNQLDNDDIRFIKSMPTEIKTTYKGYKLHFCHYSHYDDGVVKEDFKYFSEQTLDNLFKGTDTQVVFFGHIHTRKLIISQEGRSYFCLGSSGCVKTDKTFYTYFDANTVANDNFDVYRIDVRYNRKRFVQKMQTEPIPEKIRFAKKYYDIDLTAEPTLPNAPPPPATTQKK